MQTGIVVFFTAHHIVGDVAVGRTRHARVGHLDAGRVDAGVHISHVHEHALAVPAVGCGIEGSESGSGDGGGGGGGEGSGGGVTMAETELLSSCWTKLLPNCRATEVQSNTNQFNTRVRVISPGGTVFVPLRCYDTSMSYHTSSSVRTVPP